MVARCVLVFALFTAGTVGAHHSRSAFNLDSSIEVEGTLIELAWRNPHAFLVVESIDESGNTVEWTFEGHSIAGLMRNGWTRNTFDIGERVVVVPPPVGFLCHHVVAALAVILYRGELVCSADCSCEHAPGVRR